MLFTFYEKYIFRKLRLQSYRNTKKGKQKMINQFNPFPIAMMDFSNKGSNRINIYPRKSRATWEIATW